MFKTRRKLTEEQKKEDRCKKYGCDGNCYSDNEACIRIDYCPETRRFEGLAFVIVMLIITFGSLALAVLGCLALYKLIV